MPSPNCLLTASGSRYDFPGVDHEGRQTCRFENTLASLVLKRLHVHIILTGGHRLKIVDNGIDGSETAASSLISSPTSILCFCFGTPTLDGGANNNIHMIMCFVARLVL